MRMKSIGQQLVTQWYDVQQLAYLHNLVIKSPTYQNLRWPNIDAFLKIHGESHIFIGSRPKNARESLNRLELATGISSATNFARDSRSQRSHKPNSKNTRVLKSTTTVADLFFASYIGGPEEDRGIANIHRILDELSRHSNIQSPSKALKKSNPELIITRKWSNTHNINPLMYIRSIELLRLIRDKENDKFVQYFTPEYMPDESLISNIVILIHHVAEGSAQQARELGLVSDEAGAVSRIVVSAGDVMREYLEKNGDVACKELRTFCKNKKPIQDDVAHDNDKSNELVYSWLSLEDVLGAKGVVSLMTGIPIA
ncbi:hypothetical protein N7539_007084 [Penicillium diatomitis]|uniref:Uncharacterized protein n=1 Tax=Penicillium diatomitis TaxID=2819901 RepID=A0A9W9WUF3_9EURO|nr:uncharacterized protein N7539_007084 [Penicillium diatomitis]KAJ5476940.1 hypothetical protein N7539_007084 [Penicillium diatomitis]